MTAVLSEKGQITIPKPLREKLGLLPGAVLEFQALNGRLVGAKKSLTMFSRSGAGKAISPKVYLSIGT